MHPEERVRVFKRVSLHDLKKVAHDLLKEAGRHRIWLLYGELGAGKTTLIKAIAAALSVKELVNSPTFSIVNEYLAEFGERIYHFDFYRIKDEAEAYDIGTEDYFYSGSYCFIEWPEKIPSLIPPAHIKITIQVDDKEHRTIAISIHDGEEENRV